MKKIEVIICIIILMVGNVIKYNSNESIGDIYISAIECVSISIKKKEELHIIIYPIMIEKNS